MAGALASYDEALGLTAVNHADQRLQAVLGSAHARIARLLEYTGRPTEAAPSYERAIDILRNLAEAHPEVAPYQLDLAQTYENMAHLQVITGKPTEAVISDERALAIRQKLVETHPGNIQFQNDLAKSYEAVGYNLHIAGKSAEALESFDRERAISQALTDAHPNITDFQYRLARSHEHIGWGYKQSGKPVEALAGFERAITIYRKLVGTDRSVITFQSRLALCLGHVAGIHLDARRAALASEELGESVEILEQLPTLDPVNRYNLACGYARLAAIATLLGSGANAAQGRAEAERAMQWLHRAVAAGYRNVALMRMDHDLDALRSRPDFQALIMDLEFPDDPFAQ
jgi:tetratricopeptide (TPR) repeat protein